MERTAFHTLLTLLFSLLFLNVQAEELYNKEEIQTRLEAMECIIKPRYNTVVENYIKGYFAHDAFKAKLILGRTATFFPIFEKYLEEHDMPEDLKYLSVLESALNPKAVSRVGATGLWQFMKETGTGYGLKMNSRIDERSCPNRSTMAAMEYMENAYKRFNSWELAIASYNCGAGNIRKAIKRSGGKTDYWEISKYLPRETRNFVPAFLGAAYMVQYHHLHEVSPEYPHLDYQLTESELIYHKMPFKTIAAVAGIPVSVVESLNPAYKKGYVPANVYGHWLVLPRRTMQAIRDYIHLLHPDNGSTNELPPLPELVAEKNYSPDEHYYQTFYTTLEGDRLDALGKIFSCSGFNLKVWNNLTDNQLPQGKELLIWFPKELNRYQPFSEKVEVLNIEAKTPKKVENVRALAPKIKPIDPIRLTPIPVDKHPHLPFTAITLSAAELKLAREQKEKKLNLKKMKSWVGKKPFRKKKNERN